MSDSLEREAAVFGRYLIGRQPTPELAARYAAAEQMVGDLAPLALDAFLVAFALRRPWCLAPLDAACALLCPRAALREKLLRLAAILEASPNCASDFLPAARGLPVTLLCLVGIGFSAAAEFVVGVGLLKALEIRFRLGRIAHDL